MTPANNRIEPIVYVINDAPSNASAMGELVHSFGHQARIFNSPSDFLADLDDTRPGCVVLDVHTAEGEQLAFHQRLLQRGLALPVILVTSAAPLALAFRSLRQGAVTVLEKPVRDNELENSIQAAIRRSVEERARIRHLKSLECRLKKLSVEDRRVLQLMLQGLKNRAIAEQLDVSLRTVENRRRRVFELMRARSIVQLTRMIVEYEHSLSPASASHEAWLRLPFEKKVVC